MKKIILNHILLSGILFGIVSCTTKPQQKSVVDIYSMQQIDFGNKEFANQILQTHEPFLGVNDSLIIIPVGKIYTIINDSLYSVDLEIKDGFFAKIQKGGSFQTIEMVVKNFTSKITELDFSILNSSIEIDNNHRIEGLNKLKRQNNYDNKIVYSVTIKDNLWNQLTVIHTLSELKMEIQKILKHNSEKKILIVYNPNEQSQESDFDVGNFDTNNEQNNNSLIILEEYFQKIADKTIPYEDKDQLKKDILKYFLSSYVEVVIQVDGKNAGRYPMINVYVETLTNTYRKIKINKMDMEGDKISKIYITEL